MTTQPAPLLTAEMVDLLDTHDPNVSDALDALATGRTRCIQPLSEEEHRAAYRAWNGPNNRSASADPEYIWLACARAMKAVK